MMRKWIGLAAVILCVAVLALLAVGMGRGVLAILTASGQGGEADPMFAEPVEAITRPPELIEETDTFALASEDPSAAWVYEETAPVDKTPGELAHELDGFQS